MIEARDRRFGFNTTDARDHRHDLAALARRQEGADANAPELARPSKSQASKPLEPSSRSRYQAVGR
jgi:hypothetical protein